MLSRGPSSLEANQHPVALAISMSLKAAEAAFKHIDTVEMTSDSPRDWFDQMLLHLSILDTLIPLLPNRRLRMQYGWRIKRLKAKILP
jgi:hypothetical protein